MMEGIMLLSVVTLIAITLYPDVTHGCSCTPKTVQSQYCSASHVVEIKIASTGEKVWMIPHDKTVTPREATAAEIANHFAYQGELYRRYKIRRLVTLYKGDKPQTKFAFTLYHSNLCGTTIEAGKSIVMGGLIRVNNNKTSFIFGLCSFNKKTASVDSGILARLNNGEFDQHCDCQVTGCYSDGCQWNPPASVNECLMYTYTSDLACHDQSWCKKDTQGVCSWESTCLPTPPTTTTGPTTTTAPTPPIPPF